MAEFKRNSLTSALSYRDPKAALRWLQEAFGFEPAMILTDKDGNIAHSEMRYRECLIMVGSEWSELHKSPASLDGKNTQSVHVHMDEDVDAHCERARKAGAVIIMEPETQFYGDRTYRAKDPEGHIWTFGQTVKKVTPEEWDKESGLTTEMFE
ncbi:MAG: VOC family protein [Polyangiaceae bacterium]|nr:VOC family protein [Polyangiaceae bacterium]